MWHIVNPLFAADCTTSSIGAGTMYNNEYPVKGMHWRRWSFDDSDFDATDGQVDLRLVDSYFEWGLAWASDLDRVEADSTYFYNVGELSFSCYAGLGETCPVHLELGAAGIAHADGLGGTERLLRLRRRPDSQ